jgi:transcriptional regulator with PAS, ATPase and Fis domain
VKHDDHVVLRAALGAVAGAALVLDHARRVRLATPEAEELLGAHVPVGVLATAVLCGASRAKRPLAEALEAGRPVQTVIALPGAAHAGRSLRVRVIPSPPPDPEALVVLLEEAGSGAAQGSVLFHGMWTQDRRMKELFRILERVAIDDDTVLVRGETGSGKELVASAIHALSARKKGPFRAINCAALPSNLLESELFGHVRGAFTGAYRDTPGHLLLAHKGTLFLDEVAELPLDVQAKLLRVLETHAVLPIGGREPIPVDVRIVSATHRALRRDVESGRFRADLMYRLRVIPVFLPALRERSGDIPLLCEKMIEEMNPKRRRRVERVAPAALVVLQRHAWRGNVRELRNALAYAYAIGDGPVILPSDLPPELLGEPFAGEGLDAREASPARDEESGEVVRALRLASGNRARAAAQLGMSRVTLWRRMKELGLLGPRS